MLEKQQELQNIGELQRAISDNVIAVIAFGAEGCIPCKIYDFLIRSVIQQYRDRVFFGKVKDIDTFEGLIQAKSIVGDFKTVPFTAVFKDGEVLGTVSDARIQEIKELVRQALEESDVRSFRNHTALGRGIYSALEMASAVGQRFF